MLGCLQWDQFRAAQSGRKANEIVAIPLLLEADLSNVSLPLMPWDAKRISQKRLIEAKGADYTLALKRNERIFLIK